MSSIDYNQLLEIEEERIMAARQQDIEDIAESEIAEICNYDSTDSVEGNNGDCDLDSDDSEDSGNGQEDLGEIEDL
jgi:hypothetical protein